MLTSGANITQSAAVAVVSSSKMLLATSPETSGLVPDFPFVLFGTGKCVDSNNQLFNSSSTSIRSSATTTIFTFTLTWFDPNPDGVCADSNGDI